MDNQILKFLCRKLVKMIIPHYKHLLTYTKLLINKLILKK